MNIIHRVKRREKYVIQKSSRYEDRIHKGDQGFNVIQDWLAMCTSTRQVRWYYSSQ